MFAFRMVKSGWEVKVIFTLIIINYQQLTINTFEHELYESVF